jgi:hypothetical protein
LAQGKLRSAGIFAGMELARFGAVDASALAAAKVAIALIAAVVLATEVLRREPMRFAHLVLVSCAVLATAAYFVPAAGRARFVHRWEMFHYYLGAKYQPELGYERLYACVTEADVADGIRNARERRVRDLHTDQLTTGEEALARAGSCEHALGPARFAAFHEDVKAFRHLTGSRRLWEPMLEDHGYNPPPLWTVLGRALASMHRPTPGFLTLLAGIDLLLMVGAVALLGWGFGGRIALLAAIFWGTQAPADFSWVGGGFLRQDWLFCAVAGLALLRRGRPGWAGAALVTAALLRLFPAVLLVGLGVTVLSSALRRRSVSAEHRRLVLGAAAAALVLGALSVALVGPASYSLFWEHIQLRTGVVSNHMGLRTLFAFAPGASIGALSDHSLLDPSTPWVAARLARLARHAVAYRAAAGGVLLLLVFATWRVRAAWLAVALSLALVPALTEPSCYYYSVWVLALPLARARPAVGVTLLGLAAAGDLVVLRYTAFDERYFALALLYVGSSLVLLFSFAESPLARWRVWRRRRVLAFDPASGSLDPGRT